MNISFDIDGTLALMLSQTGYKPVVDYYRDILGITEAISDYDALLKHQTFIRYRISHEEDFLTFLKDILESPKMMLEKETIRGAQDGVWWLSRNERVSYCTVRKSQDTQRQTEIQEATRQWLSRHSFPDPTAVTFCPTIKDKLLTIYRENQENKDDLVLIDDRYTRVIVALGKIEGESSHIADFLKERLTLVAFGTDSIPVITNGLQIVALPSWENVFDIYPTLFTK